MILFVTKHEKNKNKEIGGLPSIILAPKLSMEVRFFERKKKEREERQGFI